MLRPLISKLFSKELNFWFRLLILSFKISGVFIGFATKGIKKYGDPFTLGNRVDEAHRVNRNKS